MYNVTITPVCSSPLSCMAMETFYNAQPIHFAIGLGIAITGMVVMIICMFVTDWIKTRQKKLNRLDKN